MQHKEHYYKQNTVHVEAFLTQVSGLTHHVQSRMSASDPRRYPRTSGGGRGYDLLAVFQTLQYEGSFLGTYFGLFAVVLMRITLVELWWILVDPSTTTVGRIIQERFLDLTSSALIYKPDNMSYLLFTF